MLSRTAKGFATLDRTVEYRGQWWLPEFRERRVSGTLTFQDGPRLELEAALVEQPLPVPGQSFDIESETPDEHGVIHGDLLGEGPVTLFDAWGGSAGLPSFLLASEIWHGSAVLSGRHVSAGIFFDHLEMSTDLLLDWTGSSGHSLTIEPGRVAVHSEDQQLFSVEYGHSFVLRSNFTFSNDGAEFVLTNGACWMVDLNYPMNLRDVIEEVVAPLQDLASFGTMHPNRVAGLYVRPVGAEVVGELITTLRGDASPPRQDRLPPFDQLMPVSAIGMSRLRSVLPGWLSAHQRLRAPISRLLAIDYAPFMYESHKSANIIQAAEGLHRALWDRTSCPPEEHAARIDDALACASEEADQWARPLLEAKNGLSQRTRLLEVVEQATKAGFPFVVSNVDSYVKALTKLRNRPAHGEATSGDPEVNYWNTEGLRWMLRAILLHEIGLDPSAVCELLSNIPAMGHAARRLNWVRAK